MRTLLAGRAPAAHGGGRSCGSHVGDSAGRGRREWQRRERITAAVVKAEVGSRSTLDKAMHRGRSCFRLRGGARQVVHRQVRCRVLHIVVNRYGTDEHCRAYLTELRWPEGVTCPKCQSKKISRIVERKQFDCDSCRYQFSVLSGTMFHDTHLALTKWFFATYLLCESKKGMSANQLKRMLRVRYETAWYLCHRIRAAVATASDGPKLGGIVEMDETYVGGKEHGGKRGRGTNKEVAIGLRQRGGALRFFHAEDCKSGTLAKYMKENISEDVEMLMTDDFRAYCNAASDNNLEDRHKTCL